MTEWHTLIDDEIQQLLSKKQITIIMITDSDHLAFYQSTQYHVVFRWKVCEGRGGA